MLKTGLGIVREEGLSKLWRGITPALYRHVVYSGCRMVTYEKIRSSMTKNKDGTFPVWWVGWYFVFNVRFWNNEDETLRPKKHFILFCKGLKKFGSKYINISNFLTLLRKINAMVSVRTDEAHFYYCCGFEECFVSMNNKITILKSSPDQKCREVSDHMTKKHIVTILPRVS